MIKIICIGKLKEKYFRDAVSEYLKRLSKYTKISLIEIPDCSDADVKSCLAKEKEAILKNVKDKDNVVLLDVNGIEYSSTSFSNFINDELSYNSNITFIIGSSNGFDDEIYSLFRKRISFSKMTFPHQLFRVLLLEQIYRSFKIINNEKYHK